MHLFNINLGPDKNPKPDRVKPEPDFGKRQKPDPSSNPTIQTRAGPEPDYLRPVASLLRSQKMAIECFFGSHSSFLCRLRHVKNQ